MIFPILVFLITNNSSANGIRETRKVIATFVYGEGAGKFVKCKAIDVYNTEIGKGQLSIDSVDDEGKLAPEVVEIIKTCLQNDYIARTYYLKQPSGLSISIATDNSDNPNQIKNNDSMKLHILHNVTVDNDISRSHILTLMIRYSYVEVHLTTDIMKLTILENRNQVVDCSVSYIKELTFLALRIKKANNQGDFMTLMYSTQGLFLEYGKVSEEGAVDEEPTPREPVFQASIGHMQDLGDEYYAEIKIEPENTVVRILTKNKVTPVRLIYGFINEEKNKIMFLRGSRVLVHPADDSEIPVISAENCSWAFNCAGSLAVAAIIPGGELEDFRGIKILKLEEKDLRYNNKIRTFWVLHFSEVSRAASAAA